MAFVIGEQYQGLTQEGYDYLMDLDVDTITQFINQNFTKQTGVGGQVFWVLNPGVDTQLLTDFIDEEEIDPIYGLTYLDYSKSGFMLGDPFAN